MENKSSIKVSLKDSKFKEANSSAKIDNFKKQ